MGPGQLDTFMDGPDLSGPVPVAYSSRRTFLDSSPSAIPPTHYTAARAIGSVYPSARIRAGGHIRLARYLPEHVNSRGAVLRPNSMGSSRGMALVRLPCSWARP